MPIKIEPDSSWGLYSELYPRICAGAGERIVLVRGWKMTTKDALLNECSAALQFPPRRGGSWDSFEEDLISLEWIGVTRKVLVILEAELVLRDEDDRTQLVFYSILQGAPAAHAAEWLERGNLEGELQIILQCDEQHTEKLEQLLARAKACRTTECGNSAPLSS